MAAEFPCHTELGNLSVAHTGMANMFASLFHLQASRAAQVSGDTQAMWAQYLASPSFNAASAQRMVTESGGGFTRKESNPGIQGGT